MLFRSEMGGLLNQVALLAYHLSIEWFTISNYVETVICNSHWVRNQTWYKLPPIYFNSLISNQTTLSKLSPRGLLNSSIDKFASKMYPPESQLIPVDEALFQVLDRWREEALRYSHSLDGADLRIHILFVQLFVLRAIEDRNLSAGLPPLISVLEGGSAEHRKRLIEIFQLAKKQVQTDLFNYEIPELPEFIVEGIIRDFIYPRGIPLPGAKYNFDWISTDLLGRAYEKYVATILTPTPVMNPQLRLWDQPVRDIDVQSQRKAQGIYYTPDYLVNFLTDEALNIFYGNHQKSPSCIPRIIDFACGSGSFLTNVVDKIITRMRGIDPSVNWGRRIVESSRIFGIDIDSRAVEIARLALWLRLAKEPEPLPLPRLEETIVSGDALVESSWKTLPTDYDIILGNPPYLPLGMIQSRQKLQEKYQTAKGRFDYSSLFVELAISKLANNGVLGMVLPNRVFSNKSAANLRQLITAELQIKMIVDFGSIEVFLNVSSYIGLVVAEKNTIDNKESLLYVAVKSIPMRYPEIYLHSAAKNPRNADQKYLHAFSAKHPMGGGPWIFMSKNAMIARNELENQSDLLSNYADVHQGIKTGANDIFVVELEQPSMGAIVRVRNGFGESWVIEKECLRPVVYGNDIQRYELIDTSKYLIFPYKYGKPLSERDLRDNYPNTYKYLCGYKDILENRNSLSSTSKYWYELIRQRDQRWLTARKLLMKELATEPAFSLDHEGGTYLIGGTAVVPHNPEDCEVLLAYLNSNLVSWYLNLSSPTFRAGFRKIEPGAINNILVPKILFSDQALNQELSGLARKVIELISINDYNASNKAERDINHCISKTLHIDIGKVF